MRRGAWGHVACLSGNAVFLFEGKWRLYSPILKEFIEVAPETVTALANRYIAKQVAIAIEYDGHVNERGYWNALTKEWKRVVSMRASWLPDSVYTYERRVEMANQGRNYWWCKQVDPGDSAACCPQSAGDRTVRPNPPPRADATPLKVAMHGAG